MASVNWWRQDDRKEGCQTYRTGPQGCHLWNVLFFKTEEERPQRFREHQGCFPGFKPEGWHRLQFSRRGGLCLKPWGQGLLGLWWVTPSLQRHKRRDKHSSVSRRQSINPKRIILEPQDLVVFALLGLGLAWNPSSLLSYCSSFSLLEWETISYTWRLIVYFGST